MRKRLKWSIEFEREPFANSKCEVLITRGGAMGLAYATTWWGAIWLAYRYLLKDEDRRAIRACHAKDKGVAE